MAGGAGGGNAWKYILAAGLALVGTAFFMHSTHAAPTWLVATLNAIGGLSVVFGSVEAMIKGVDGIAVRAKMNEFVAGTMAGLASNIPELVMLGFVLAARPRIGFIVIMLTLHVGAASFGIYSGLLPRDADGHAKLPDPLVKLSTDLYACAGGVFFAMGSIMMLMRVFRAGEHEGTALSATDLYVLGALLIAVEVVAVIRLVQRFSDSGEHSEHGQSPVEAKEMPSVRSIVLYCLLGVATSVVGGHAVGEFADVLVTSLTEAGYSEMVGAIVLSIFAMAGAFVMIGAAHSKGMYDIALANVSGAVNQVPFVVLPVALILLAAFAQTGVIPLTEDGGVLPIDLETTSVFFLAFPSMLVLWKAVQDDGTVNWVETAAMIAIFALAIYLLAAHG